MCHQTSFSLTDRNMKQCCWCVSLEVGTAFSAIGFLITAIAEMFLERFCDLVEVERAVVVLHAFVFMAGAIMLVIGILAVDTICIFLFVLFGLGAIIAKIAALVVFMTQGLRSTEELVWIVVYSCTLLVFHLYMMIVAWSLGKKIWNQRHQNIRLSVTHHRWGIHRHHSVLGV